MTQRAQAWLRTTAVAAAFLGLFLGLLPVTVDDGTRPGHITLRCGTPWAPTTTEAAQRAFYLTPHQAEQSCRDAHGARAPLSYLLLGYGAIAFIATLANPARTKDET